jgi:hypothetical protein
MATAAVKIEKPEGALWINICSSDLSQFRVINNSQHSIHGFVTFKGTLLVVALTYFFPNPN